MFFCNSSAESAEPPVYARVCQDDVTSKDKLHQMKVQSLSTAPNPAHKEEEQQQEKSEEGEQEQ